MAKPVVKIFPDAGALADALARHIVDGIARVLASRPRFSLALTGGSTPRLLYERLARQAAPLWSQVHFFWGDDRFVPPDDPDSNYRLAREALLAPAGIPAAQVHPMPTALGTPAEVAEAYERELRSFFAPSETAAFDLVLLGIGEDGHVASLFPGRPALRETRRWAAGVSDAPKPPPARVTLTLPALNAGAEVHFLAAGAAKAEAVGGALSGRDDLPAAHVRPASGRVTWWLDQAAARHVP